MTKNKRGFTIIEVVLVLAIAGLIFLMVFIALPALQRSQRNTRRRQDMSRILSAFNEYQANNNGRMPDSPTKMDTLVNKYINGGGEQGAIASASTTCYSDQFCDPDGTPYSLYNEGEFYVSSGGWTPSAGDTRSYTSIEESAITHKIHYWRMAKCSDEEGKIQKTSGKNDIAIALYLEGGAIYCGDNQ